MTSQPRVFNPVSVDDELLSELEGQRARQAAVHAQASSVEAARASSAFSALRREYPWLSPGAALSMAKAGITPDSPAAAAVADTAARKRSSGYGFGWGTVGDVVQPVTGGVAKAVELSGRVAKPVLRTGVTAANTPYEEGQGAIRNIAASGKLGSIAAGAGSGAAAGAGVGALVGSVVPVAGTASGAVVGAIVGGVGGAVAGFFAADDVEGKGKWEAQSNGLIALQRLRNGEKVRLGSGWLPNFDAGAELDTATIGETQRARSRRVTIAGRSVTPGRLLATSVVEPGTKPWNVVSGLADAAVALGPADPGGQALKLAGAGVKSLRGVDALVETTDDLAKLGKAQSAADVAEEAGAVDGLRRMIDPSKAEAWWQSRKGRDLAETIAAEPSAYAIWDATGRKLDPQLAVRLADADSVDQVDELLVPEFGAAIRDRLKWRTFKPFDRVRLLQSMPGSDLPLDVGDLGRAERATGLDRWLRNADVHPEDRAGLVEDMMRAGDARPAIYEVAERAMQTVAEDLADSGVDVEHARRLTRMFRDDLESSAHYWVDGFGRDVIPPGVVIEGAPVPLAHPHLFVEHAARALPLPDARDLRTATSFLRPLLANAPAEAVIGSIDKAMTQWKRLQLLRGAYVLRVVGEEQARIATTGLDSAFHHPVSWFAYMTGRKGAVDVLGEPLAEADAFQKAMNKGWAGWADSAAVDRYPTRFRKGDKNFMPAWAGELLKLKRDPVAARAIAGATPDELRAAFRDGDLSWARREMAQESAGLADAATADDYVASIFDRINQATGGDPELLDLLRTGLLEDATEEGVRIADNLRPTPEFLDELATRVEHAPDWVAGDAAGHRITDGRGVWDKATTYAFSLLGTRPTNKLSRSPVFKQNYWGAIEDVIPKLTAEAQRAVIAQARDAGMGREFLADLATRTARTGELTVEHADHLAKSFALDETRKLLYDLTEKSQFFDANRLMTPFGEAWLEMVKVWAKIGTENPQVPVRRIPQIITAARDNDTNPDTGFFRENGRGEEVFTYPGAEFITDKLLGVPVPLTGRVAGLSMATEVLPGVGPVVSIPAGWFLPDTPEWETVRDFVFPFGEPERRDTLWSLAPAWARKAEQAINAAGGRDERMFASTTMDVARYLASTGEYDTSSEEGMARLASDAKDKAAGVYAVRAVAQWFAPSAPSPEWVVQDTDGQLMVAQVVADDFHDLQDRVGPAAATSVFLDLYGPDLALLMEGKTKAAIPNAPVSAAGITWEQQHPAIVKRFPNAYGYFATQGDFDFEAYEKQIAAGKRKPLTVDEATKLANARIGRHLYDVAKARVGDKRTKAESRWLSDFRDALRQDYVGYDLPAPVPQAPRDKVIDELVQAAHDPELADTKLAESLRIYLTARDRAIEVARAGGLASFADAKRAKPLRAKLRAMGETIAAEDEQFAEVWKFVFVREVDGDEDPAAPAATTQEVPAA